MNAPKTTYEIIYNGKNITQSILPYVVSLTYTDKSRGEADEIELLLEDSQRLWQNEWFPQHGDTITAKIFHLDETLECGEFTVDDISGRGSKDEGDTFTIKGIAAGVNKNIRTKQTTAHESKTLREIVNTIASKNGYTVVGKIDNVSLGRETQYRTTDLKFLNRLALEYGYTFSIRGKQLVFTNIFELEGKAAAVIIPRSEITSWDINDKTANTYKGAKVSYHNPKKKSVVSYEVNETSDKNKTVKNDKLEIRVRAENKQQAEIKTKVALYRANSLQQEGTLETPGNTKYIAGIVGEVQGLGMFSGNFYFESSAHAVDKDGGYKTSIAVKRIGLLQKAKQKTDV